MSTAKSPLRALATTWRWIGARVVALSVGMSCLYAGPAEALRFEPVSGRPTVLWARDCGIFENDRCSAGEDQFSPGDTDKLGRYLQNGRYDEVWFASGGGSLFEGIRIGNLLRSRQLTTRVPAGFDCVSACTVAFLGGVFRFVDETGHYRMHAASVFLGERATSEAIVDVVNDPERGLASNWRYAIDGAREISSLMFPHLQAAVHPLGRMPPGQEELTRSQLVYWSQGWQPVSYLGTAKMNEDVARIKREGPAAAQDILMRLERDAISMAIESLRTREAQLGSRTGAALSIFETMYSSRITNTAELSQQTMRQLGIVTVLLEAPR